MSNATNNTATAIDRRALVARHAITWNDVCGRLALGNGEFCFGADGTGLQTFGGNTMSHWGWHSFPLPTGWTPEQVPATGTFQQGRNLGGDIFPAGTDAIRTWMFDNPHRLNLGRLQLRRTAGRMLVPAEITDLQRTLDLWTGLQTSRYRLDGQPVMVETCLHPTLDLVAVRLTSPLLANGALEIALDLPYPALSNDAWVGDFERIDGHSTQGPQSQPGRLDLLRRVDATAYHVALQVATAAGAPSLRGPVDGGRGAWTMCARGHHTLALVCAFAAQPVGPLPSFAETARASAMRWEQFWMTGGAIDLSASRDPRWRELERRLVLSQYHMAAQSAGTWPAAETGLLGLDPWRGQFHMEMVWWHVAHYALWDRWELTERALCCYARFATAARALAEQLGYRGLKWQKSVGPEGRSAPWVGNQVLLWKQPHPIFFAELEYRLRPTRATLERWADIVQGTAEHMADYPVKDATSGRYSLVPAMPPSEQGITRDTVFDLAYWRWGLAKAQEWRQRRGQAREPQWDEVRENLAPLPTRDGVFVHSAEWQDTYSKRAFEHPDMVGVLGMLPALDGVNADTAQRTVRKVWETWNWNACWGWDFPWMAMAAARTGEPEIAVAALLQESARNQYDVAGLNAGGPCPYLPGNGGLLYAVAMMAAGWDGAPPRHAPGFPDNGQWTVRWEGLKPAL